MTYTSRSKIVPCIGVEITNTNMKFIELNPTSGTTLVPERYGNVEIAPGVIDQGLIKDRASLVESFKRLRTQTSAHEVRFTSFDNEQYDDTWSEIFAVAGFSQAHALDKDSALCDYYFGSQQVSGSEALGFFEDLYTIRILVRENGLVVSHDFSYPLGQSHTDTIRTIGETSLLKRLPLTGAFGQNSKIVLTDLHDKTLDVYTADVWKHCFSYKDYVPMMGREDAFAYALPVVLAYWGATTQSVKSNVPSLNVVAKPVDTNSIEHALKNITPMSKPVEDTQEGDSLPTVESRKHKQPAEHQDQQVAKKFPSIDEITVTESNNEVNSEEKTKTTSFWLQDVDQLFNKSLKKK